MRMRRWLGASHALSIRALGARHSPLALGETACSCIMELVPQLCNGCRLYKGVPFICLEPFLKWKFCLSFIKSLVLRKCSWIVDSERLFCCYCWLHLSLSLLLPISLTHCRPPLHSVRRFSVSQSPVTTPSPWTDSAAQSALNQVRDWVYLFMLLWKWFDSNWIL